MRISFLKKIFRKKREVELFPDEVFLDSSNLPQFDLSQCEGQFERPISRKSFVLLVAFFLVIGVVYVGRMWSLQVQQGEVYAQISENNSLRHQLVFSNRGILYDRNGVPLAWNTQNTIADEFALRQYATSTGQSHVIGYVKYPAKDKYGYFYKNEYEPFGGAESVFNEALSGKNGLRIVETNVFGEIVGESTIDFPVDGTNIYLSIDSTLQQKLHETIKGLAEQVGFTGGAGVLMDVHTGEIIALTSYPEFNSQIMTDGADSDKITEYVTSEAHILLNRAVAGQYTPGSIIKPYIAAAALEESIISPYKNILSTGKLRLPNPYYPDLFTIFTDWKAHGYVDMRKALAVSSNIYFYNIGGGFEDQEGLGIGKINTYTRQFGFGDITGINLEGEKSGIVPSPEWKEKVFEDGTWRLGDTYNTSIGQYGFQVTPIQAVRAVAAIANEGTLLQPSLEKGVTLKSEKISFDTETWRVVKEGMRQAVTDGTAGGLNISGLSVAAKTGTAELGSRKQYVNSWVTGFFPYENPRYAFVVIMEKGPVGNTLGGVYVMRHFLDWLKLYQSEYVK